MTDFERVARCSTDPRWTAQLLGAEYREPEPAGVRIASFCLRWFIFAMLGADALLFVVAVRGPH